MISIIVVVRFIPLLQAISEYSRLNKQLGREISLFNGAISLGMSALAGIVILCGGHMVQVCLFCNCTLAILVLKR
jgi:hypothetical protein